ncbi:hypothetical protein [Agrococcus sp. TF02-05]|uniref:hypothetical protein n=1 Tax=Agrococcus sp. TF02-05 TaxID=2815211 RepID=UPI001AA12CA8|nr:hypothetical protein [Agrococcus sp. TF02-05]MBO1770457.1 hypothetical protein [Agrococcus sp. TF02-05]
MPEIAPARLNYLKNAKFIIRFDGASTGGDDYAGSCRSIRAESQGSGSTFYGMKPSAVYSEAGGWQITFEFADDYETATSLWRKLWENDGEQATVEFWPHAGGVGFRTVVTINAPGIGGTTREVATSSVTLQCAKPELLPDPTPAVIEGA